jgi:hypothetical protein
MINRNILATAFPPIMGDSPALAEGNSTIIATTCICFAIFTISTSETPVLLAAHLSKVFSSIAP